MPLISLIVVGAGGGKDYLDRGDRYPHAYLSEAVKISWGFRLGTFWSVLQRCVFYALGFGFSFSRQRQQQQKSTPSMPEPFEHQHVLLLERRV
jgi:hypothetical protein